MTRLSAVAALLVLAPAAIASKPGVPEPAPDPARPHDIWDFVPPAGGIDRATRFLKGTRGGDMDLLAQIAKLMRENPRANQQDIARILRDQNQNLDPIKLQKLLDSLGGTLPGGMTNPGFIPPPDRPVPPDLPVPPDRPIPQPQPVDPPSDRPDIGKRPIDFPPVHPRPRPNPFIDPADRHPDRPHRFPGDHRHWDREFPPRTGMPNPDTGAAADEQLRRNKKIRSMLAMWEKNFGPIGESPAVRSLIMELLNSSNGPDGGPANGLLDILNDPNGGGEDVANWLENQNAGEGGKWELPDLGWKDWKLGGGDAPDVSGTLPRGDSWWSGSGQVAGGSAEGSWLSVVLFVVTAAGALVLWRFWPYLSGKLGVGSGVPRPLPGLGPWPVDPREIADRDALVRAFEYLSVLVCGAGAKAWNHVTIAAALGRAVGDAGTAAAEPLARLYAVARYTPADEPLTAGDLAEARLHLSRLAGVSAP